MSGADNSPDLPETVVIMRNQAVKLMAISNLLRDEDLHFRGDLVAEAEAAISDVAQECALQLGGMSGGDVEQ